MSFEAPPISNVIVMPESTITTSDSVLASWDGDYNVVVVGPEPPFLDGNDGRQEGVVDRIHLQTATCSGEGSYQCPIEGWDRRRAHLLGGISCS